MLVYTLHYLVIKLTITKLRAGRRCLPDADTISIYGHVLKMHHMVMFIA